MKINELIAEQQDIEEGIGSFLGKAAGHVTGGLGAAWKDAKQGYKAAKSAWDDPTGANSDATNGAAPSGGPDPAELRQQAAALTQQADQLEKSASQPAPTAPAPTTPAPTNTTAPEPAAVDPGTDHGLGKQSDGKFITPGQKFDTETGKPLEAPVTTPAAPETPAPGLEIDPAKAAADKAAKNQADADQRNADIEKTKQANAAKAQQDAAIKAAADAARAKPGFQQSPEDKLAIKAAERAGIREAEEKKKKLKKKKIVAEFKSNFLGMKI
jgi:hypothetical protein